MAHWRTFLSCLDKRTTVNKSYCSTEQQGKSLSLRLHSQRQRLEGLKQLKVIANFLISWFFSYSSCVLFVIFKTTRHGGGLQKIHVSPKTLTTTIAKLSIQVHHISLLIRIAESRVILHTLPAWLLTELSQNFVRRIGTCTNYSNRQKRPWN